MIWKFYKLTILIILFGIADPAWGQHSSGSTLADSRAKSLTSQDIQQTDTFKPSDYIEVPVASEKTMRYYETGNVWWLVNMILGVLIPGLILFSGFSAKLRNGAQKLGRKWIFIIFFYYALYASVVFAIYLPINYFQGFLRAQAYGLSNQSLLEWFVFNMRSLFISMIRGGFILCGLYLILRLSPRRWWIYAGVAAIPLYFFLNLVHPIWVAPQFNTFTPLENKALEGAILTLAQEAGIEDAQVLQVDKSRQTTTINAYVIGMFNTKQIVLWDTAINNLNEEELKFVMAHEIGHYVENHRLSKTLLSALLIMLTLFFIHHVSHHLIDRFKHRFRFNDLSDVASYPLIVVLFTLASLVTGPINNSYSRYSERQADTFAIDLTGLNHAAATAFVKIQHKNLSNPNPGWMYTIWRETHPPLGERINFFNTYRTEK